LEKLVKPKKINLTKLIEHLVALILQISSDLLEYKHFTEIVRAKQKHDFLSSCANVNWSSCQSTCACLCTRQSRDDIL